MQKQRESTAIILLSAGVVAGIALFFTGVETPHHASAQSANQCYETDNGKEYGTAGFAAVGEEKHPDSCNGNILTEYYCNTGGAIESTEYTCQYGCSNGKCLADPGALPITARAKARKEARAQALTERSRRMFRSTDAYQQNYFPATQTHAPRRLDLSALQEAAPAPTEEIPVTARLINRCRYMSAARRLRIPECSAITEQIAQPAALTLEERTARRCMALSPARRLQVPACN